MIVYVYFKQGDLSSERGLVLGSFSYENDFFKEPPFYGKKIEKSEYDELLVIVKSKDRKFGFEGVVNEEGYQKYLKAKADLPKMEKSNEL